MVFFVHDMYDSPKNGQKATPMLSLKAQVSIIIQAHEIAYYHTSMHCIEI